MKKKLREEIHELLSLYQNELLSCHKIWIHAPGTINQMTLFGNNDDQQYLYPIDKNSNNFNSILSQERLKSINKSEINNNNNNNNTNKKNLKNKSKEEKETIQVAKSNRKIINKHQNIYRLYRKDPRICRIPITTYGITIAEIERIHYWLSTCWFQYNKQNENEKENDNNNLSNMNNFNLDKDKSHDLIHLES